MKLQTASITNANAARVAAEVRAAILAGDAVVDFSGVTRCDTAAVACILDWLRTARGAGRDLRLVALPVDLHSLAGLYNVAGLLEERAAR